MKKIIRHGKIDRYIHTCSKCGCEFLYDENDLWTMGTLSCPECGKNDLPKNDPLHETIEEQETREHISNNEVSEIARMQQQIDTFKAALLHINDRITHGNKCNLVYTDPLDDNDKHSINNIIEFIDQHSKKE